MVRHLEKQSAQAAICFVLGGALSVCSTGSGQDAEKQPQAPPLIAPNTAAPVRLVDRLNDTMIRAGGFPLTTAPKELLSVNFENKKLLNSQKKKNRPNPVAFQKGMLRYGRVEKVTPLEWEVPVFGNQTIRISCRMKTEALIPGRDGRGASLEIDESDLSGRHLNDHHYLRNLSGTVDWTTIETDIHTDPRTTQLVIRLTAGAAPRSGSACFDDLKVTLISRTEELSSLPRYVVMPEKRVAHAMVRRVSLNGKSEPAVAARVGSEIVFDHGVKMPAELHFAIGLLENAKQAICFRVMEGQEKLDEHCTGEANWTEVAVPLKGAGPLVLETVGDDFDDSSTGGLWGNPMVVPVGTIASPPIVIVVVDTLRADGLGPWGAPLQNTPNLNAFAKRSMVFENAFSTSSWTAPALGSVITGRWTTEHCAGSRIPLDIGTRLPSGDKAMSNKLQYRSLATDVIALPDMMKSVGYITAGFNSNYFFSEAVGFDRSFDSYQSFRGATEAGGGVGLTEVQNWLNNYGKSAAPFFLVFHIVDPHMPYLWRAKFADPTRPIAANLTGVEWNANKNVAAFTKYDAFNLARIREIKTYYDAEVRFVDDVMKQFFELLKPYDPVIAFIADHGEAFKEHTRVIHGNSMYNEVVKVPLLLRLPKDKNGGTRIKTSVSLVDIAPTLLSLTSREVTVPQPWRGKSLLGTNPKRDLLLDGIFSGQDMSALIQWPYKLIWNYPERETGFAPGHPFEGGFELYQLENDPEEKRNLAAAMPDKQKELFRRLEGMLQDSLHGTHIRCRTGNEQLQMVFQATRPINQILSMTMENSDRVTLSSDKREMTIQLQAGGDVDWLVVRSSSENMLLSTDKPIDRVTKSPDSIPEGRCAVWSINCGKNSGMSLNDAEIEALRAMGYLN